jgi:hypothetical protein
MSGLSMKAKIFFPLLFVLSSLQALQDTTQYITHAFSEITSMPQGTQPLDFERTVFITENAYRDNVIGYQDFKATLDIHASIIGQLIKANEKNDWKKYQKVSLGILMETD